METKSVLVIDVTLMAVIILAGWFLIFPWPGERTTEQRIQETKRVVPEYGGLDPLPERAVSGVELVRRSDDGIPPELDGAIRGFSSGIEGKISSTSELEWRSAYDSLLKEISSGEPRDLASSGKNIVYLMNVYLHHPSSARQQYSAAILYNLALINRFSPKSEAIGFPELSEYEWLKEGLFHVVTSGNASESRRMGVQAYAIAFGIDGRLYDFIVSNFENVPIGDRQSYVQAAFYGATGRNDVGSKRLHAEEVLSIALKDPEEVVSEWARSLLCASGNDEKTADFFDLSRRIGLECDRR